MANDFILNLSLKLEFNSYSSVWIEEFEQAVRILWEFPYSDASLNLLKLPAMKHGCKTLHWQSMTTVERTLTLWQCNRASLPVSVRNPILIMMMKDISLEISHLPLYSILHSWPPPPLVQDSFNFIFDIVVVLLLGIYMQWHVPLFERHSTRIIHIQFYNLLETWSNSQVCRRKHARSSSHIHAEACTLCNGICKCSTVHSQSFWRISLLLLLSILTDGSSKLVTTLV